MGVLHFISSGLFLQSTQTRVLFALESLPYSFPKSMKTCSTPGLLDQARSSVICLTKGLWCFSQAAWRSRCFTLRSRPATLALIATQSADLDCARARWDIACAYSFCAIGSCVHGVHWQDDTLVIFKPFFVVRLYVRIFHKDGSDNGTSLPAFWCLSGGAHVCT